MSGGTHGRGPAADEYRDDLAEFIAEKSSSDRYFAGSYSDALKRSELIRDLVSRRKGSGLRQADVAAVMGTTQSCVSALESGDTDPHFSTLQRYARALGVGIRFNIQSGDGVVEYLAASHWNPADLGVKWRRERGGPRALGLSSLNCFTNP